MHPLPRRRSIRIPGYDYSQPGAYFITLCTEKRRCVFGDVVDCGVKLNAAGSSVSQCWGHVLQWWAPLLGFWANADGGAVDR